MVQADRLMKQVLLVKYLLLSNFKAANHLRLKCNTQDCRGVYLDMLHEEYLAARRADT